jgi:D-alanyl-D-alanine carboxypeptidase
VAQGGALTVRHLIHQTSGLADYYEAGVVDRLKQGIDARHTLADVLQMTKHLPPQAAPDSGKSHYSDTNYQLLGAIIAAVTGQPFHDVVQDRICAPLGLTETEVYQTNIQNAADILPIFYKGTELRIPLALSSMGPDGGVVSTLNDLLIFLRAYHAGQLFDPQNHSSIQHWTPLFFPLHYGYGLMRFKLPRWMTLFRKTPALIGHSGSTGSFAFYAPQSDIFLAGTFNQIGQSRRPFGVMLRVLRSVQRVAGTG